jgi:hypothetical protein
MRSNITGARISSVLLDKGIRLGDTLIPSTGTAINLTANHPPMIRLNLTGATNIQLPAVTSSMRGLFFDFINESTGAIAGTLTGSTGGALGTGVNTVIGQGKAARAVCNGSNWYSIGATTV